MRKFIVKKKWKKHLAARSRSELKARARVAGHRRDRARRVFGRPKPRHFKKDGVVKAPKNFSMINNPNGMIDFFQQMQQVAHDRNVIVDLSSVEEMTPDAVAGLLAANYGCKLTGATVRGNVPNSERPKKMLNESGFRNHVRSAGPHRHAEIGRIAKFQRSQEAFHNRFDQYIARDLIEFANLCLKGRESPHPPSYSVFSEAMLNTWNHASAGHNHEPWWASVYFDAERCRACFTFLDRGVGIFGSHQLTLRLRVLSHLRLLNPPQLLEQILKGQIPSTTKEVGRGNGIPGMYDHCKAGRIKGLTIISNDASGNAESETYVKLPKSFPGTLLYWEIGP